MVEIHSWTSYSLLGTRRIAHYRTVNSNLWRRDERRKHEPSPSRSSLKERSEEAFASSCVQLVSYRYLKGCLLATTSTLLTLPHVNWTDARVPAYCTCCCALEPSGKRTAKVNYVLHAWQHSSFEFNISSLPKKMTTSYICMALMLSVKAYQYLHTYLLIYLLTYLTISPIY